MTAPTWTRFSHTDTSICFDVTQVQLTQAQVEETTTGAAHLCVVNGEVVVFSVWPRTPKDQSVFYVRNTPSTDEGRRIRNRLLGPELLHGLGLEAKF